MTSRPIDEAVAAAASGKFIAQVDPHIQKITERNVLPPPRGPPADLSAVELEKMLTLPEAAQLAGVSVDTIRRHYPQIIKKLSPRRRGVKTRDAIAIGQAA